MTVRHIPIREALPIIGTRVRISMGIHAEHDVDGTVIGLSQIADTEPRVTVRWDDTDEVTCPRVARLEIIETKDVQP